MCNHANEKCDRGRPDCWSVDKYYDDAGDADGPPDRRIVSDNVPRHLRAYSGGPRVSAQDATASQTED